MKRIASGITALLLASGVWASEYWIQVLSVKADSVMEADFLKRVKASGHAYETVLEEGLLKVRIGNLPSYEAAAKLLPEVRREVTADAFIVKAEVLDPAVETVPKDLALIPNPKAKMSEPEAAAEKPDIPSVVATSEADAKQAETVAAVDSETPVQTGNVAPEEAVAAPKERGEAACVCLYDKHALRKAEITAALSYYRNSPYHRFGPMEQDWSSR